MKLEDLSDDSTSSIERRRSNQSMLLDPQVMSPTTDEQPGHLGLVGEDFPMQSAWHTILTDSPTRPPFTHSLSFVSDLSLSNSPYENSFLPATSSMYSKPSGHSPESLHSQNDLMEEPGAHGIHTHGTSPITADGLSNITEFNTLTGYPPYFGSFTHSSVPPPQPIENSQSAYDNTFYVPPSQAQSSAFEYETSHLAWNVDNTVDPAVAAGYSTFDYFPQQSSENVENLVVEGLGVNTDRDSTSSPFNEMHITIEKMDSPTSTSTLLRDDVNRDDIKSTLNDTFAHSRLKSPYEKDSTSVYLVSKSSIPFLRVTSTISNFVLPSICHSDLCHVLCRHLQALCTTDSGIRTRSARAPSSILQSPPSKKTFAPFAVSNRCRIQIL